MRTSGNDRPHSTGNLRPVHGTGAGGSAGAENNAASGDATELQESTELGALRGVSGSAVGRRFSSGAARKSVSAQDRGGDAAAGSASAGGAGDHLLDILGEELTKLGYEVSSHDHVKRLLTLESPLSDSAVGTLRSRVLEDPELRGEAGARLRHYSAEALAKGVSNPEDRLLRLELLMLAAPEATRAPLMRAIRADLQDRSEYIRVRLSEREVFIPQVTIGGGPQGQTVAHCAHEFGLADGNLVVDASSCGDGNFGSVRMHLLNSETRGGYAGSDHGAFDNPMRSQNPLHGSPVQVEDLNSDLYPTAADIGDAAAIGLYAASRKGSPVLVNTVVTDVEEVENARGRYRVTMRDNASGRTVHVLTDHVIDATGLGRPSVPLRDPASKAYIDEQTARLTAMRERALLDQAVMHSEDMLRATVDAPDEHILDIVRAAPGDIAIVGWGDSSKTPLLRIRDVAEKAGLSMRELLGDRKIVWIGPKSREDIDNGLWGPYAGLKPYFDEGLVHVQPGRLETITAVDGTNQSSLAVREKDGSLHRLQSGRVILAMGMKSGSASFLSKLASKLTPEMKVPVHGDDPAFDESALCTRLHVDGKEHDIFFVGMSSGLQRPSHTSYLEFFGWKTRQFIAQHLVPKLKEHDLTKLEKLVPTEATA
ncbi:hypothetical protein R75461_05603 [Paraburkholderia nemoris]|uniref:hypothetical protein n=1 Tax=Paraburkholderia nemoris TaxID=2793076 RepID=UPI00190CF482|nr:MULTISPECIES: hypothetical protein [Paraburkholderia]MBK3784392.1 lysine N(6)-hydroxylase/L-ornithine N(5)-oxygenase family protein [Paraburkholderia aspalathi]CAE6758414.1 hypothetical protein LMG22931_03481 [Paraburkholderia nemoris]CAE6809989.1 hypothetical protein R75461_05603 [Paraburkholderia nemoris]